MVKKISPSALKRVWTNDGFRLFLSHKSDASKKVAKLAEQLDFFGVAAFVAHQNIKATQKWQTEIENALHSMQALAAIITKDFHQGSWTDQEVGFALGRQVPTIPVAIDQNPRGLLGKIQAVNCEWENAADKIAGLLMQHGGMLKSYVTAMQRCASYEDGNRLATLLPFLPELNEREAVEIIDAYNGNGQLVGSYGFNGTRPTTYGPGLLGHLHKMGYKQYELSDYLIRLARKKKNIKRKR